MKCEKECNQKILIVDDSELNRAILADMLGHEYEIIEAENGVQAVDVLEQYKTEISIVLAGHRNARDGRFWSSHRYESASMDK